MKKLLLILLCLPLLFSSCKKDEEESINGNNSSNSNSQACGNVSMDVNFLVNETFNNSQYEVGCIASLSKSNGIVIEVNLILYFNCINNTFPIDKRYINLSYSPTMDGGFCEYREKNCDALGTILYSTSYSTSLSSDSIILNLTNIDEINYKMSGNLALINTAANKPNIDINFSDVPISIFEN
tara:strand:+ start:19 stop:567 length:549 start_codon:yes stop_codon:yes gene_type:complete